MRRHLGHAGAEGHWNPCTVVDELVTLAEAPELVATVQGILPGSLRENKAQLFSTVASQALFAPGSRTEDGAELAKHEVTTEVAVLVVDLLEMVDVQQEDGEWPAVSGRTRHLALEELHQVALVVQQRKSIRDGEPVDGLVVLRLHLAALVGGEELQNGRAQPHEVPGTKQAFTGHLLVVHEGAVGGAAVADKVAALARVNRAVLP